MDSTTEVLIKHALKDSTRSTYSSAQRRFISFCEKFSLSPLPASEETLLCFVSLLYREGLKGSSIHVYMSAVKNLHAHCGLCYPEFTPRLSLALKGAKVLSAPPVKKLPITFTLLCKMFTKLADRPDALLLKTAMALAFFGCLRAGEICLADDLKFDSHS